MPSDQPIEKMDIATLKVALEEVDDKIASLLKERESLLTALRNHPEFEVEDTTEEVASASTSSSAPTSVVFVKFDTQVLEMPVDLDNVKIAKFKRDILTVLDIDKVKEDIHKRYTFTIGDVMLLNNRLKASTAVKPKDTITVKLSVRGGAKDVKKDAKGKQKALTQTDINKFKAEKAMEGSSSSGSEAVKKCVDACNQLMKISDTSSCRTAMLTLLRHSTLDTLEKAKKALFSSNNKDARIDATCAVLFEPVVKPVKDVMSELSGAIETTECTFQSHDLISIFPSFLTTSHTQKVWKSISPFSPKGFGRHLLSPKGFGLTTVFEGWTPPKRFGSQSASFCPKGLDVQDALPRLLLQRQQI